jgi:hypothetical protein
MKNVLILAGVGLAAYGVYLAVQKKKRSETVKKTFTGSFAKAPANQIYPSQALQAFDVSEKNIFAGGTYRNIPWPNEVNQAYVQG